MNWSNGRLLQMHIIYSYSYIYINASNLIYIISPLKLVHCAPPPPKLTKHIMNIWAAHLNTDRATEMLFTILELA